MSVDGTRDTDQVYVLRNDVEPSRRKCIISFQSSDSLSDLATFAFASNAEGTYCGRQGVHTGVSNELRRFARASQWSSEIVPALETCYDVTCVGHSLGGAMCNLFTMCANHGSENLDGSDDAENWDDYATSHARPRARASASRDRRGSTRDAPPRTVSWPRRRQAST